MISLRHRLIIYVLFILTLLLVTPVVQAMPSDIQGHWAEDSISNLVDKGVLNGYPDGSFHPDQSITRAELAKTLAVAYKFQASNKKGQFPDTKEHWAKAYISALADNQIITGYPDGTFKPEAPITRAEIVAMLTRLLKIGSAEEQYTMDFVPSFPDLEKDYWAFHQIELAFRLGILPGYFQPEFRPSRLASRADTAWMIEQLLNLNTVRGKILDNPTGSNLLTVEPDEGEIQIAFVPPEAIVFRNNITTTAQELIKSDQVTIFFNRNNEPAIIKSFGDVNKNDLLGRLSAMVKGRLSSEQISSILAGDWEQVKESIKGELYNQLLQVGLTPEEAESILVQDWAYLDTIGRDRLSAALSSYLGITKDLSRAILDRDFARIKEYAKIELAAIALEKLLGQGLM